MLLPRVVNDELISFAGSYDQNRRNGREPDSRDDACGFLSSQESVCQVFRAVESKKHM